MKPVLGGANGLRVNSSYWQWEVCIRPTNGMYGLFSFSFHFAIEIRRVEGDCTAKLGVTQLGAFGTLNSLMIFFFLVDLICSFLNVNQVFFLLKNS